MMNDMVWDLAIVGAGPAGSTCACSALANDVAHVALFDREIFPRDKSCGDAIDQDAIAVLTALGLGDIFGNRPLIEKAKINFPRKFRYLEKLIGIGDNAYCVVERKTFDDALCRAAIKRGAHDFTGCAVTDAEFDDTTGLWRVVYKTSAGAEATLRARVLVGADGASSRVRRVAGLPCNSDAHLAVGIRSYVQADGLDESSLRIDYNDSFIPGYGWVIPLGNKTYNIGLCLDRRDYKALGKSLEMHLEGYVQVLSDHGVEFHDLHDLKAYPLPLADSRSPLVPGAHIALIGDAAAMIDPFTGEGIQFGVWAGNEVGHVVAEGLQTEHVQTSLERFVMNYTKKFSSFLYQSQQLRVMLRYQRMMMS